MKRFTSLALAATTAALLLGGDTCSAAIVFDNGNHISSGRWASANPPVNRVSDDFRLPVDTLITDVHWKGIYGATVATGADDFTINIYNDSGAGQPTVPIPSSAIYSTNAGGANRAPTGELAGPFTVYGYSAVIPPFLALGGTNYWLEIFNNATNDTWYWSMDINAGNSVSTEFGSSWNTMGDANTFQLTNDLAGVPEAGSLVVWSVLMGVVLLAKRIVSL